jgi:hypothetical protein
MYIRTQYHEKDRNTQVIITVVLTSFVWYQYTQNK